MKDILLAFLVIFITATTKGQFKDDVQLLSNIPSNEFPKDSTEVILEILQPLNANSLSASPKLFKIRENRFITLLAGYASAEGESGIHFEAARIYQPRGFGFGA